MKRFFLTISAILTILLSGCQVNNETDISSYRDELAKAQKITVISADTSEVLETITSKDDIEHFILALNLDKWKLKTLPEKSKEIGSFSLAQEETIQYRKADRSFHNVVTITLYNGSYIGFEASGLDIILEVSEDTADYLNEFFE